MKSRGDPFLYFLPTGNPPNYKKYDTVCCFSLCEMLKILEWSKYNFVFAAKNWNFELEILNIKVTFRFPQ